MKVKKNGTSLRRTHIGIAWFLIVVTLILQALALNGYFRQMEDGITKQLERGLINENNKSQNYFQNMMETKFEWMKYIASLCHIVGEENPARIWKLLEEGDSDNYRIGIVDEQGTILYGDHKTADISDRDYFSEAMKGKPLISRLLVDGMEGQDSICLVVPVPSDSGKTTHAIVMEYSTIEMGSYINDGTAWSNYGVNLIVNKNGQLIASCTDMEGYETIYDALHDICEHKEEDETCVLGSMQELIAKGEPGCFNCGGDKKEYMLYHQPIGINDWSLVSIGNQNRYENTMDYIKRLSMGIVFVTVILLLILVLAGLYIAHCRQQRFYRLQMDELTGVYTRAAGHKTVLKRFRDNRKIRCYGCLFVDVDNFKEINDTYGHDQGDKALGMAGTLLKEAVRESDIVCRYGGDEFCIWLFGDGTKAEIEIIANRIQSRVASKSKLLRFSIGATTVARDETDCDAILKRADEAVYEAKRQGRNRIVFYDEVEQSL